MPAPHDQEHFQLYVNPRDLTLEPSAPVSLQQLPIPTSTASFIPSEVQTSSVDYTRCPDEEQEKESGDCLPTKSWEVDPELSHPGESAANFSISNSPYHSQSANFLGVGQSLTVPSPTYSPEFANSSRSQSPCTASVFPSVEEVGDLSGTRPSSYLPTLDDCLDIQSPSRESLIGGNDYYGLVPSSLETSRSQPIPGISHYLSLEPTNRATHSDYSPNHPSDLLYNGPSYCLSAGTPSSLQGPASSQSTQYTDIEDSGNAFSREFSAACNGGRKDSPSNAAFLYAVNSTDFTDSPIAQPSQPSASQLRNNNNNHTGIARAKNLDLGCKETTSPPLPVRKQGPLSCPVCGKSYFHRHKLNKHIKSHKRDVKCTISGCEADGFYRDRDLRRHVFCCHPDATTESRQYFCEFTGCKNTKGFSRKDNYQRHIRLHDNIAK